MRLTDLHHRTPFWATTPPIDPSNRLWLQGLLTLWFLVALSSWSNAQNPSSTPPIEFNFNGSETDHHRLHEAIHAAHVLAELGAGYEAARILEAITLQAPRTEPGEHAGRILEEWGLEVPLPAKANSSEISRTIIGNRSNQRQDEARTLQFRNLLAMRQYKTAAAVLIDPSDQRAFIPDFLRDRFGI